MNTDFTPELAQLMKFAGETATAIRMYSTAYNSARSVPFGRCIDESRAPIDLMFLADTLHHFGRIGSDIESGEQSQILATCDYLLRIFTEYEIENTEFPQQSKPTFELWSGFVKLEDARAALRGIREKANGTTC